MQNSSVNPTKSKNRDKEKNDQVNNEKRKQIRSCPHNNSPAVPSLPSDPAILQNPFHCPCYHLYLEYILQQLGESLKYLQISTFSTKITQSAAILKGLNLIL